jgi:hypothetical protein
LPGWNAHTNAYGDGDANAQSDTYSDAKSNAAATAHAAPAPDAALILWPQFPREVISAV